LTGTVTVAADIETITHGSRVELEDHLVDGKYVLFDFYADWCGPCRVLEPHVKALADQHPDQLAVRKVDIINWQSEVARQYRMQSIPHLKLYDPSGQLVAEGGAQQVMSALTRSLGGSGSSVVPASRPASAVPLLVLLVIGAVVAFLLFSKGQKQPAPAPRPSSWQPPAPGGNADPREIPLWFVELQGSFAGPFTVDQLENLNRQGQISRDAPIRRRGDADWRQLHDVLEEA
jgi:thiol-disulfide isomerase/thioredoxin